jgi:hypothetical protein
MATYVAAPQRCLTACLVPACRQGTKRSPFTAAYCLIATENRHPVWPVAEDAWSDWAKLTRANLDGLSGILHTWKSFVRRERLTLGAWFEVKPNRFK